MRPTRPANDRSARVIVWSVWAGMLALLAWSYVPVASPIALAEDWYTVPLLTGHRSDLAAWSWEQNNEHRMPVARLLLLGAVTLSGGDYRAGGLLNMALLAAIAAGLMLFARHLRAGVTDPADAFFPLTFLHFGHSVDVLFPFQITFVLSFAFVLIVGCALFLPGPLKSWRAAIVAGTALLLLPLSGFIGLVFVPPLAACIFSVGWRYRRGADMSAERAGAIAWWLMSASTGALVLSGLYFVGYEHPSWNPPSPGVASSFKVVLQMFALGFGPAAQFSWKPPVLAAVLFLSASCWLAFRRMQRATGDRVEVLGGPVFLASTIGFAAAVGWGRAGYVPEVGIPLRYIWIALPAFVAAYCTWLISGARHAPAVLRALALTMLVLVPLNTMAGHRFFADWYHNGMTRLQADLRAGVPVEELAARHGGFLVHWWTPSRIARHMEMLREAGIPPFGGATGRPEESR